MSTRALLSLLAGLFFACPLAFADGPALPGHQLSPHDARAQADRIFPAQVVGLAPVDSKAARGHFIAQVVYLSRPANGIHPPVAREDQTLQDTTLIPGSGVPVAVTVGPDEVQPSVGKSYLFYVKETATRDSRFAALKLSPVGSEGLPSRLGG